MDQERAAGVWVLGYGSLIFRADFSYIERRVARLRGFERRLWQSSPDHRGTPEAPGRVVTLIENQQASLLGVAYLVESARACEVLADLDRRERAGYERVEVELEFVDPPSGTTRALVYQARSSNPGFVADSSDEDIAEIVGKARGPSGDNASYVRLLSEALRALGEDDPHVSAIARLLAEKS